MAMFLVLHPMEFLFLNPSDLVEHLAMLQSLTLAINFLSQKILKQGYRYHKLRKTFFYFIYRRFYALIRTFISLTPGTFGASVLWRLKKIVGTNTFSAQFLNLKWLVITLMYCNRLHSWWSTQLQLTTLLSSLITVTRAGPRPQTMDGSGIKTYL